MRERVFATARDEGFNAGVGGGTHIELRGFEIDLVADFGLGLFPESVGLQDHGTVIVLRIGGSYGS